MQLGEPQSALHPSTVEPLNGSFVLPLKIFPILEVHHILISHILYICVISKCLNWVDNHQRIALGSFLKTKFCFPHIANREAM